MSPEMRMLRAQQAAWWDVYLKCQQHQNCLVLDSQLKSCSTQQLIALYSQLQSGRVVKEWRDEVMDAWAPQSLIGARQP
jgi:hypothetical protein